MESKNIIPILTPADVELRAQRIFPARDDKGPGCVLLVYKDARVDMRILDQVYGPMNWQRNHEVVDGQLFCKVSVWDAEKCQWVTKSDVGTESKTEAEKGRSSDSFKRACFNWGIGRELYSAPFIYIELSSKEFVMNNGKPGIASWVHFRVTEMEYDAKQNQYLTFTIVDQKGNVRFSLNQKAATSAPSANVSAPAESKPANGTNTPPPAKQANTGANTAEQLKCCNCGAKVSQKVHDFSMKMYRMPLCMNCQKNAPR